MPRPPVRVLRLSFTLKIIQTSTSGLEHATIRDNIIFGSPFVLDRYDAVLDACALRPDLAIFDAGDLTGKAFVFGSIHSINSISRNWRKGDHVVWWSKSSDCSCKSNVFTSKGQHLAHVPPKNLMDAI